MTVNYCSCHFTWSAGRTDESGAYRGYLYLYSGCIRARIAVIWKGVEACQVVVVLSYHQSRASTNDEGGGGGVTTHTHTHTHTHAHTHTHIHTHTQLHTNTHTRANK